MAALGFAVLAALLCHAVLRWLLATRWSALVLDRASGRSMHAGAIPRIGGWGIAIAVAGSLASAALLLPLDWPSGIDALALAVAVLFALSFTDDVRPLPAGLRLAVHLAASASLAYAWDVPAAWIAPAALLLAWGTNLYNFMDGADGLAGGMTVFGYATLALAAQAAGEPAIALLCASVAGAALGFLPLNWHPARLFLGDAGSIPLGFLASALSLLGVLRGWWTPTLPLVAFFPFVFDATVTLGRRALRGASLTQAHREHLYQRAALTGLGHRGVALGAYALMAVCAALALVGRDFTVQGQLAILILVIALHLSVTLVLERRISRSSKP